jgi:ADP-ribose pyrophosphatase
MCIGRKTLCVSEMPIVTSNGGFVSLLSRIRGKNFGAHTKFQSRPACRTLLATVGKEKVSAIVLRHETRRIVGHLSLLHSQPPHFLFVFMMSNDTNTHTPRIDSVTPVASTKWLELQTLHWTDHEGKSRLWDVATRTTKPRGDAKSTADAVVIIPFLRYSPDDKQNTDTLLVKQFRPPVGGMTVEFPAGLIDKDETVEQAAVRELREETGYVGEACNIPPITSRALCMSPGLTDETVHVVLVEVDLNNPYNQGTPKPELDVGEHCIVERVSLQAGLKMILDQGSAMPLMGLYLFALGYELGVSSSETSNSKLPASMTDS